MRPFRGWSRFVEGIWHLVTWLRFLLEHVPQRVYYYLIGLVLVVTAGLTMMTIAGSLSVVHLSIAFLALAGGTTLAILAVGYCYERRHYRDDALATFMTQAQLRVAKKPVRRPVSPDPSLINPPYTSTYRHEL